MAAQDSAYGITSGTVTLGASLCIGLSMGPNGNGWLIQLLPGGGTCTVLGASSLTATGYVLLSSTPVAIGGQSKLFINEKAGVTSMISFIKTINSPSEF